MNFCSCQISYFRGFCKNTDAVDKSLIDPRRGKAEEKQQSITSGKERTNDVAMPRSPVGVSSHVMHSLEPSLFENGTLGQAKVAIVTGASSGIDEAITRALLGAGIGVVGLARRKDALREIVDSLKGAKGKLHALKCDLSNEGDILNAFECTNKELDGVDVLVNNAAPAVASTFADKLNSCADPIPLDSAERRTFLKIM